MASSGLRPSEGITQYRESQTPPSVSIVSIKRADQVYRLDSHRGLSLLQSIPPITVGTRATIEYQAIDFNTLSIKQQYRIRLTRSGRKAGLRQASSNDNDGWETPTKSAIYEWVHKKPGSYTFEVQAIDRDLNYSKPAKLILKVVPPFYLRAAFLIPTVSGGAILLTALFIFGTGFVKHRRQVLAYQKAAVEELQDARQMQLSLLPESAPALEGIEIAGKCISANTVGGDFFDYLPSKRKNEIAIVIGDVTGKGLKGAMNAVMTDGIIHMALKGKERPSPASLLTEINDILNVRMERENRLAAWCPGSPWPGSPPGS